jgi:hypothetical protein
MIHGQQNIKYSVLVLISSSYSSSATAAAERRFCVSAANCCYMGAWRYVRNGFTGNSETMIESHDFMASVGMLRGMCNVVGAGCAKCDVRSARWVMIG